MFMNSDPNSDSKQCPESKLGWVHKVHTQGPGCAHTARTLRPGRATPRSGAVSWRRIVAPLRLCRSVHWLCRAPPGHDTKFVSQHNPCRARWTVSQCRVIALYRRPLSRYKNCIVTQLGLNQDTRSLSPRRDTKFVSRHKTPCRARWAVSRARVGRVAAPLHCVVACHYALDWPCRTS